MDFGKGDKFSSSNALKKHFEKLGIQAGKEFLEKEFKHALNSDNIYKVNVILESNLVKSKIIRQWVRDTGIRNLCTQHIVERSNSGNDTNLDFLHCVNEGYFKTVKGYIYLNRDLISRKTFKKALFICIDKGFSQIAKLLLEKEIFQLSDLEDILNDKNRCGQGLKAERLLKQAIKKKKLEWQ